MMSSVTAIINATTYVSIAFVAVSLIVSSIMIGVITLISVQERMKEIGILRAIGASKKTGNCIFAQKIKLLCEYRFQLHFENKFTGSGSTNTVPVVLYVAYFTFNARK